MCTSRTEELAAAFCDRSLPKELWTHEAHLSVGLWHLLKHAADEALALLRERITAYNETCGVQNSDSSGYHETITRFFIKRIEQFLENADPGLSMDELAEEVIRLLGDKRAPLDYYSRERIMSVEARRGWVEPDLRSLD